MTRLRLSLVRDGRLLVVVRGLRSVSQGALVVDFALYLRALHWSGAGIGAVLTASMVVGIALTALLGPLSDRVGCKRLLLGFEAGRVLAALAALSSGAPSLLVPAAFLGQYGRGGNGTAGPFAAVEQAWLAHLMPREKWVSLYSLNSAAGLVGQAAGALLAVVPAWLSPWLPGALAFRPLFGLALITSLIAGALISQVPEVARPPRRATVVTPARAEHQAVCRQENRLLLRLALGNLIQGVGLGLSGPMIAYWFAVSFGQGPKLIGPVMAGGFLLSGAASVIAGRLAQRHGIVPVVVGMQLVGVGLVAVLPLVPVLSMAAGVQIARSLFNRGTDGVRQALSSGLVRSERRGFAASLNSVSVSVPRALGPLFAGMLFDAGWLAMPFLIAAGFQAAYLWLYAASFTKHDRESRRSAAVGLAPAASVTAGSV
jgi:MFS family permease